MGEVLMKKQLSRVLGIILAMLIAVALLGGCTSSSKDSYKDTLVSGQKKYYSGQPMTKQEYNAVKNFNKWKSSQGSKTYDQWGK